MRRLARVDAALETCGEHLTSTGTLGTEVEASLTAYVSAVAYSSFEAEARRIVSSRGAGDGKDPRLAAFTAHAAVKLMRSIKVGELAGAAAWFHRDCKQTFQDLLTDEQKTAWDNIVSNRHGVAHEGDPSTSAVSSLTFREFEGLYPQAVGVLDVFELCLA